VKKREYNLLNSLGWSLILYDNNSSKDEKERERGYKIVRRGWVLIV